LTWVFLSLGAAAFQTVRNGLARSLAGRASPALISWARFAFNLPFSSLLVVALVTLFGVPQYTAAYFFFCFATAITQLLGNVALVAAFERGNFAQAIVLHKLEVVLTAAFGVLFFAEAPSLYGWAGVVVCSAGMLLMNRGRAVGPAGWRRAFHIDLGTMLALSTAVLLTLAAFALKEANTLFVAANPRVGAGRFEAAAHTLLHSTWMEVVVLSVWLGWASPGQFRRVGAHWRRMLGIGVTGFCGSLGWYWAFSLTFAAYVKAVGQIEAAFAVALAVLVWGEKEVWRQLPGIVLVMLGIALVLLD
jgi:drug/metabolite transporter (DMT)-like permease